MSGHHFARSRGRRRRRGWTRLALDAALAVGILGLGFVVTARLKQVAERTVAGKVVVNDGDTLTLNDQRIRLRGIDAPEFDQICTRNGTEYPCGREAIRELRRLTAAGGVTCTGWERDRYDRLLARCKAGGKDLGEALVRSGWAVSYGDYQVTEAEARRSGAGLWAGSFERPHDWRVSHGEIAGTPHDFFGQLTNWLRQIFGFRSAGDGTGLKQDGDRS